MNPIINAITDTEPGEHRQQADRVTRRHSSASDVHYRWDGAFLLESFLGSMILRQRDEDTSYWHGVKSFDAVWSIRFHKSYFPFVWRSHS